MKKHGLINWTILIVILIGLAVLAVTAVGLRKWQRGQRASEGLRLGQAAYQEGRWEEAAKQLGRYVALVPDDVDIVLKYADAQLNTRPLKPGNVKYALQAYRNVLRLDKGNVVALARAVDLHIRIDAAGEAVLIARRALEAHDSPEIRRWLAVALNAQKQYDEAAQQLQKIIKDHPEETLAYEMLGKLALRVPQLFDRPAAHWFDEAVQKNPSCANVYIARAEYYLASGEGNKALEDLKTARKLDISDINIKIRLARGLIAVNSPDVAGEILTEVHKSNPANPDLWNTRLALAIRSGSSEEAVKVAESALANLSASARWDFLPNAIEIFIQSGRLDQAEQYIEEIRRQEMLPAQSAFWQGMIAQQKGRHYEAANFFRQAMEMGDKSSRVSTALAESLARCGDYKSALQQLRELILESPDQAINHLNLARLLLQDNRYDEAAEQIHQVMQIDPANKPAALLDLQIQMQQLASRQLPPAAEEYQQLKQRLDALAQAAEANPEIRLLQFRLALQQQEYDQAQKILADLEQRQYSRQMVGLSLAELLLAREQSQQAINKLQEIISEFPDSTMPIVTLANLYDKHNQSPEAEKLLQEALNRMPSASQRRSIAVSLADKYLSWKKTDQAYNLLAKLSEELPDDVPLRRRLLHFDRVIKDAGLAHRLIEEIKKIEGERGWQWRYETAQLWLAGGSSPSDYSRAVSLLKENLQSNPSDQESRMLLVSVYNRAEEYQLAALTCRDALSRSPDNVSLMVAAIVALNKAGDFEQADEIVDQAARENISHPALAELDLQSRYRRGKLADVEKILEEKLQAKSAPGENRLLLASVKIRLGKFAQAAGVLDQVLKENPDSFPARRLQVELMLRQNKGEEAMKLCDEIVERYKNAPAYLLRAATAELLGQGERSETDIADALKREPENAEIWLQQYNLYRRQGRDEQAVAAIEKALSLRPEDPEVIKRATSLFLQSKNPELLARGKKLLDESLQSIPGDVDLRFQKAQRVLAENTRPAIEEATALLKTIVEDQPRASHAWAMLSQLAYQTGQYNKAMDLAFQGLIYCRNDKELLSLKARAEAAQSPALAIPTQKTLWEADPNNLDVALRLAQLYEQAGDPAKAAGFLRSLNPAGSNEDMKRRDMALAIALYKNGDKEQARQSLEALQRRDPNDPQVMLAQIQLLIEENHWADIALRANQWHKLYPNDHATLLIIAKQLAKLPQEEAPKTAESILQSVLHDNPDDIVFLNTLALFYQSTNRPMEAAPIYEKIITQQPDNIVAFNNLAWILCEKQGQYQQALELAQKGLAQAPNYLDLLDTRGMAYYRLGKLDSALEDFNRCIKLYPQNSPGLVGSLYHQGKLLAQLHRKDDAVTSLKQALELNAGKEVLTAADISEIQRLLTELTRGD